MMTTKKHTAAPGIMQDLQDVPAEACRCSVGLRQLSMDDASGNGNVPVKILARTGEAIDHWYWGRIIHDLGGFTAKDKIAIDYSHDYDEAIGFLDQFSASHDRLDCTGQLVPLDVPGDRATEIITKAKRGIPYEASIDWNGPAQYEFLEAGMSTQVNGRTFEGPGTVVRKWTLTAVAICPHGADSATETLFQRSARGDRGLQKLRKPTMSDHSPAPEFPEGDPPADRTFSITDAQKFQEAFGDQGLKWLVEGKTFEECKELQYQQVRSELATERQSHAAELAKRDEQIGQLRKQLQAAKALAETEDVLPVGADPVGGRPRLADMFDLSNSRRRKKI